MIQSLLACPNTLIDLVLKPGWDNDYEDFDSRQEAVTRLKELLESEQLILYLPTVVTAAVHLIVSLRFGKIQAHSVIHQVLKLGNSSLRVDHQRILEEASSLIIDQAHIELYEAALLSYAYTLKADAILANQPQPLKQLVELKKQELPGFNTHILRTATLIHCVSEYQLQDSPEGKWIYTLTPHYTPVRLPCHSTPIDFAYKIHTDVGNQCIGAKVNGVSVPLNRPLNDYDIVEITRGSRTKPDPEWLKFVATRYAKKSIQRGVRRFQIEQGWQTIRHAFDGRIRDYKHKLECLARQQNRTLNDLVFKVGADKISLQALEELINTCNFHPVGKEVLCADPQDCPLLGSSYGNWHLASCCSPLPGDAITGVVGAHDQVVRVHRSDCPNLEQVKPERLCDLSWNCGYCSIQLLIVMSDRPDTFRPILDMLAEILADSPYKPDVRGVHISHDGSARTSIKLSTSSRRHLDGIMHQIKCMPGVLKVKVTKLMPLPEK